jgi:hypothetical protein
MTSIVGIRCTDGVVIGADSAASFSDGRHATIEQLTDQKIKIIGDSIIIAGTGYVGHMQRFTAAVEHQWVQGTFSGKNDMAFAQIMSSEGLKEFNLTHTVPNIAFKGKLRARMLDKEELVEQENMVDAATKHFSTFQDLVWSKN